MRKTLFSALIGILLLILWGKYFLPQASWQEIGRLKIFWLLIGAVFYALATSCRAFRWGTIMRPLQKLSAGKIWSYYLAGLWISYIFPFKVEGAFYKSYLLKKTEKIPVTQTLSSVFVEKFYAFTVMLASLIFLPLFPFRLHFLLAAGLAFVGFIYLIMLALLFGLIAQQANLTKLIASLLSWLPASWQRLPVSLADSFINGLNLVKRERGAVFGLTGISWLIICLDALNLYAYLNAVNQPVTLIACYFGSCLLNLCYILPAPPASIGTNELYGTLIFVFGFSYSAEAVPVAILTGHTINALLLAFMGTLALIITGGHWREIKNVSEEIG